MSALFPESRNGTLENVVTSSSTELVLAGKAVPAVQVTPRDFKFWMCILTSMLSVFLVGLDIAGLTNALPTIVEDLHGTRFEWVGAAYALAATAFCPLTGAFAQAFGRKECLLVFLFMFAVGSAVGGAAPSMNVLIAGRAIQGVGAGGLTSLPNIIVSDLVPLHERGIFNAYLALGYALAGGISLPVAGVLAEHGQWRWFFYMNLPICAVTALLAVFFVRIHAPKASVREKLLDLDWIGIAIVMGSTTSALIALTWSGTEFSWGSPQVLVPLILGLVGMIGFIVYDAIVPQFPLVPFKVLSSVEAISGNMQGFFSNFYMLAVYYYVPVYLQACKGASPVRSGILCLPTLVTMPSGIVAAFSIAATGRYRIQLWFGWVLLTLSAGLYCLMHGDSSLGLPIGIQIVGAVGLGIILANAVFAILAPIPSSLNPNALAFFLFVRFFAQSWGVSIGGTVLQNELQKRVPAEFLAQFPDGTSVAYALIPVISQLPEPLRTDVRAAFADSLRVLWQVLIGVGGCGLLSSLLMKGLSLKKEGDDDERMAEGGNTGVSTEGQA